MAKGQRGLTQNEVVHKDKKNLQEGEHRRHSEAGGLKKQPGGLSKIYYARVFVSFESYPGWWHATDTLARRYRLEGSQ